MISAGSQASSSCQTCPTCRPSPARVSPRLLLRWHHGRDLGPQRAEWGHRAQQLPAADGSRFGSEGRGSRTTAGRCRAPWHNTRQKLAPLQRRCLSLAGITNSPTGFCSKDRYGDASPEHKQNRPKLENSRCLAVLVLSRAEEIHQKDATALSCST